MRLQEVEEDLPILLCHYDRVIRRMERRATKDRHRVSRAAVIATFVETRSFVKTAKQFDVSPATVNNVVSRAVRLGRKLARLQPSWKAGDH